MSASGLSESISSTSFPTIPIGSPLCVECSLLLFHVDSQSGSTNSRASKPILLHQMLNLVSTAFGSSIQGPLLEPLPAAMPQTVLPSKAPQGLEYEAIMSFHNPFAGPCFLAPLCLRHPARTSIHP